MRFLIDHNLDPVIAEGLRGAGHDAVHLIDYQLQQAEDAEVLDRAEAEERILITQDTGDFGQILHQRGSAKPSIILLRTRPADHDGLTQLSFVLAALERFAGQLDQGAMVVIRDTDNMRVRMLPFE